ncbi:hypothetical protein, partial [Sphingomonas sp.]|uniref:hypothetical protein n=1 Tax=Sphingomonas sp. TaxID=28214 RepID=UPI003D6D1BA1
GLPTHWEQAGNRHSKSNITGVAFFIPDNSGKSNRMMTATRIAPAPGRLSIAPGWSGMPLSSPGKTETLSADQVD